MEISWITWISISKDVAGGTSSSSEATISSGSELSWSDMFIWNNFCYFFLWSWKKWRNNYCSRSESVTIYPNFPTISSCWIFASYFVDWDHLNHLSRRVSGGSSVSCKIFPPEAKTRAISSIAWKLSDSSSRMKASIVPLYRISLRLTRCVTLSMITSTDWSAQVRDLQSSFEITREFPFLTRRDSASPVFFE